MTALRSSVHLGGPSRRSVVPVIVLAILITIVSASLTAAEHEGTNILSFVPVAGSESPGASGHGTIEYHGGREPSSRWTSTFQFSGLEPEAIYVVMVMGRTGEEGSAAATAFSPICTVPSDANGNGSCWDYEFGMQRIGIVQLRHSDGSIVLQATRKPGGPGEIRSLPNAFSPSPSAPVGSPLPVLASPIPG